MPLSITRTSLIILLMLCAAYSHAQTAYITDSFFVPMRSGPTNGHRIIKNMRTGDAVTILQRSEDDKWIQVTNGSTEGWIPSQYIMNRPTARKALERSESQLKKIREENAALKSQSSELAQQKDQLDQISTSEKQTIAELTKELEDLRALSAGTIELDRQYQKTLEENQMLSTENDSLSAENLTLRSDSRNQFMWYGAGLLLLGMLLMTMISAYKSKPRYSDWK